jgi:hypothetical protein
MNMRRIAMCVMAMALAAGCASDIKKEIQFDDLPTVVRRGVEAAYPDAHVTKVVQETNKETGVVQYKVTLTDKEGKVRSDSFAPDGTRMPSQPDYKAGVPKASL